MYVVQSGHFIAVPHNTSGLFTTSTTCCPIPRGLSLSTWPLRCSLLDTVWGLLLAKNWEAPPPSSVVGGLSDLEIALGEGPGEAGIEVRFMPLTPGTHQSENIGVLAESLHPARLESLFTSQGW